MASGYIIYNYEYFYLWRQSQRKLSGYVFLFQDRRVLVTGCWRVVPLIPNSHSASSIFAFFCNFVRGVLPSLDVRRRSLLRAINKNGNQGTLQALVWIYLWANPGQDKKVSQYSCFELLRRREKNSICPSPASLSLRLCLCSSCSSYSIVQVVRLDYSRVTALT
jgi:hypothetical protein